MIPDRRLPPINELKTLPALEAKHREIPLVDGEDIAKAAFLRKPNQRSIREVDLVIGVFFDNRGKPWIRRNRDFNYAEATGMDPVEKRYLAGAGEKEARFNDDG